MPRRPLGKEVFELFQFGVWAWTLASHLRQEHLFNPIDPLLREDQKPAILSLRSYSWLFKSTTRYYGAYKVHV